MKNVDRYDGFWCWLCENEWSIYRNIPVDVISFQLNQTVLLWERARQACLLMWISELKLKMLCVVFLPITFLVAGASKLCPHQCSCYGASALVDCRSRGFTHIPHSIPHGTWLLDLSGNELSELRSTSFTGIWVLRILLLSQSNMQVVHSQVRLI